MFAFVSCCKLKTTHVRKFTASSAEMFCLSQCCSEDIANSAEKFLND